MLDIKELLSLAHERQASDLHITVGVPPIIRVHGALKRLDLPIMTPYDTERILLPIINEKLKPVFLEKGELDMAYSIPNLGRYRVNFFKQRGSVAAAIRIVSTEILSPAQLGIPDSVVDLYKKQRGLILVTGPTGSGKSTTLASFIKLINDHRQDHIITLEDPIEYLHKHGKSVVNQREMGLDSQGFGPSLRSALRQDPDVILIGEMRDLETISTAITAAETGHLVLSTLHTTGAVSTIDRIIDVFPTHQQQQVRIQLSMVLVAIVSQQLLPRQDMEGRVAAFEVLKVNHAISNLIREGKTHQLLSIMQTQKAMGMQTMDDALLELFMEGKISKENALMYAQDQSSLNRRIL